LIDRQHVAAILVAGAFVLPDGVVRHGPVTCPVRRSTGLPCPACGLTRSWQAAAHLRLRDSIAYHPFGAISLLGAADIAFGRRSRSPLLVQSRGLQKGAAAVWVATWLWRVRQARRAATRG
jgi:hypothetical protein